MRIKEIEGLKETNLSEVNEAFVDKLIEKIMGNDKALRVFIDENLNPQKVKIDDVKKNIESLKTMDKTQQLLVKARAKHFEESNDPSKYFPALLAIIGIVISMYGMLPELSSSKWIIYIKILVIAFLAVWAMKLFTSTIEKRSTAIYFNSLVINIKYDEE